jgi:hypothetical protein
MQQSSGHRKAQSLAGQQDPGDQEVSSSSKASTVQPSQTASSVNPTPLLPTIAELLQRKEMRSKVTKLATPHLSRLSPAVTPALKPAEQSKTLPAAKASSPRGTPKGEASPGDWGGADESDEEEDAKEREAALQRRRRDADAAEVMKKVSPCRLDI